MQPALPLMMNKRVMLKVLSMLGERDGGMSCRQCRVGSAVCISSSVGVVKAKVVTCINLCSVTRGEKRCDPFACQLSYHGRLV